MAIRKNNKLDVLVVVDRSSSLSGCSSYINRALREMLDGLKRSPDLSGFDVYLTLACFSDMGEYRVKFKPVKDIRPEELEIKKFSGQTNPGATLHDVTTKAMERYTAWKKEDSDCAYHPILFFFTDGNPYPVEKYMHYFDRAAAEIKQLETNHKLIVVPCGFGSEINKSNLAKLTNFPDGRIVSINNGDFNKLERFFAIVIPHTSVVAANLGDVNEYDDEYETELTNAIAEAFGGFFC